MRCSTALPTLAFLLASYPLVAAAADEAAGKGDASVDTDDADASSPTPDQAAAPDRGATAKGVTPPKLKAEFTLERPAGVSAESLLLELEIDAQGLVTKVALVGDDSALSEAFRQRVLREAARLEFTPARVDGEAVAVKFKYRLKLLAAAAPTATRKPAKAAATPVQPAKPAAPPVAPADFGEEPVYEATAEVEGPPEAVTSHRMQGKALTNTPGTRGDAIRSVEVLPGVARSDGDPILRGASSNESQVLFDGAPVPLLYHFGGITSFVQGRLVDRIDYQPGNFSARYGRISGGLISVESREPRRDRLHLMLDLSLLESAAMVETPIGDSSGVALAARRSNIDFFFKSFVPEDAYSVVAAPVYWDYQALFSHSLSKRHTLRFSAYGSRDSIALLLSEPSEADPSLRGEVSGALEFHRVQVALESELSDQVSTRVQATYGRQLGDTRFGALTGRFRSNEIYSRGDLKYRASDALELRTGFDFAYFGLTGSYEGNRPTQWEGDPGSSNSLASSQLVKLSAAPHTASPSGYVEAAVRPVQPLEITLGLRADYFEHLAAFTVDPRLGARLNVGADTTFKAGVGRYTQQPDYYLSIPGIGSPDIKPYYAIHTSAGVEQRLGEELEVSAEGFFKYLDERVVATPDQQDPYFINDGTGRIYGAEFSAKLDSGDTRGFLAYTLSRSERSDRGERYRLFDQDQTHVLSLALSQDLGRGWEVGGRFRLTSGNPTTPIEGAVLDATTGQFAPRYAETNSDRLPLNHQLDLRVEKQWHLGELDLAVYLDLINAYNAENREGTQYSYDYKKSSGVSGIPFFPSLGLRGEL